MSSYKPMLAPLDDPLKNPKYWNFIKYPILGSPKLDGIRCVVKTVPETVYDDDLNETETDNFIDVCLSRELKPIPSKQVQDSFKLFSELDGELIVGNETDNGVYNRTQSHVMSVSKPHDELQFRVFDYAGEYERGMPFKERLHLAHETICTYKKAYNLSVNISLVEHKLLNNYEELIAYESEMLEAGYEGIMLRDPSGKYKWNRGTMLEGLIFKLKRFQDDEGLIVGFEEGMTNENEATLNEKGYTVRSESRENMVPAGTLGAFIVSWQGKELRVAPGNFTHSERKDIWIRRETLRGAWLKFRFFAYGVKELPRFPRAVGFRSKIDMSPK